MIHCNVAFLICQFGTIPFWLSLKICQLLLNIIEPMVPWCKAAILNLWPPLVGSMRTFSDASLSESRVEKRPEFALVLNGHSLVYALKPDLELLLLGKRGWLLSGTFSQLYFRILGPCYCKSVRDFCHCQGPLTRSESFVTVRNLCHCQELLSLSVTFVRYSWQRLFSDIRSGPSLDNPVSKLPQIILSGILVRDEGLLKDILVNRKTPLPVQNMLTSQVLFTYW